MVATALISMFACALGVWAVARVTHEVMKRLGLDLMTVLVWMGLAEWTSPAEPTRDRVAARFDERARRGGWAPHAGATLRAP